MNINPDSEQFLEIKKWDDLTEEEQNSGEWIKIGDGTKAKRDPFQAIYDEMVEDIKHVQFNEIQKLNRSLNSTPTEGDSLNKIFPAREEPIDEEALAKLMEELEK